VAQLVTVADRVGTLPTMIYKEVIMEISLETTSVILQTIKEMIQSGLEKQYIIDEISAMYLGYGLPVSWYESVYEGALSIIAIDNIDKQKMQQ
jgi:hypothetical protein